MQFIALIFMRLSQLGTFDNNAEADMDVRKWLRMEESDL